LHDRADGRLPVNGRKPPVALGMPRDASSRIFPFRTRRLQPLDGPENYVRCRMPLRINGFRYTHFHVRGLPREEQPERIKLAETQKGGLI